MTREKLNELVLLHLVPLIVESEKVSRTAHEADEFNNNYSFGCQFYANSWNRIRRAVESGTIPFTIGPYEDGNVLLCGGYSIRHHRADPETGMPRCAKRAKAEATQLMLFEQEAAPSFESKKLLLASIVAPNSDGLIVDLGPLVQNVDGRIEFEAAGTRRLYGDSSTVQSQTFVAVPQNVPVDRSEEKVAEPTVTLRPRRAKAV
jgi:hypothetical protein